MTKFQNKKQAAPQAKGNMKTPIIFRSNAARFKAIPKHNGSTMDTLARTKAFVEVFEAGGYSAASRKSGKSKALLSKYVRELEDELGVLLLNRSTRQLSLTEAGSTYYENAIQILKDIDRLSEIIRDNSQSISGRIRISAPRSMVDAKIGQSLIDFGVAFPDIQLDINADDRFVDLMEEGYDVAIRITELEDSGLIAKKLAPFRLIACASPEFLKKHPNINEPKDLAEIPCLFDTNSRKGATWRFVNSDNQTILVPITVKLQVNSPTATMRAAIAGMGVAIIPDFVITEEIKNGSLVPILNQYISNNRGIYAVFPHRRYMPAKVRALLDHLSKWFKDN